MKTPTKPESQPCINVYSLMNLRIFKKMYANHGLVNKNKANKSQSHQRGVTS